MPLCASGLALPRHLSIERQRPASEPTDTPAVSGYQHVENIASPCGESVCFLGLFFCADRQLGCPKIVCYFLYFGSNHVQQPNCASFYACIGRIISANLHTIAPKSLLPSIFLRPNYVHSCQIAGFGVKFMRLITKMSPYRGQNPPAHTFFEAKNMVNSSSNYVQLAALNRVLTCCQKNSPPKPVCSEPPVTIFLPLRPAYFILLSTNPQPYPSLPRQCHCH